MPVLAAAGPILFHMHTASTLLHHYIEFCPYYTSERLTLDTEGRELLSWEHIAVLLN